MAKEVSVKITKENKFGHEEGKTFKMHPATAAAVAKHGHTDYKPKAEKKGGDTA